MASPSRRTTASTLARVSTGVNTTRRAPASPAAPTVSLSPRLPSGLTVYHLVRRALTQALP